MISTQQNIVANKLLNGNLSDDFQPLFQGVYWFPC